MNQQQRRYCQVYQCTHPMSHTTGSHVCGLCGLVGHGRGECGKDDLIVRLTQFHQDTLPRQQWCGFNCRYKRYHTTNAHHCKICKSRLHDYRTCPMVAQQNNRTIVAPGRVVGNVKCPVCRETCKLTGNEPVAAGFTDLQCIVCAEDTSRVTTMLGCGHMQVCNPCLLEIRDRTTQE